MSFDSPISNGDAESPSDAITLSDAGPTDGPPSPSDAQPPSDAFTTVCGDSICGCGLGGEDCITCPVDCPGVMGACEC